MVLETTVLLDGLEFPEGPRWHDGKLWFSDMGTNQVMTVDLDGNAETVVEVQGQPSGLGWLPDERLLVVSMTDRRLLRLDPHGLVEVADLRELASFHCNDMVVDHQGRAYIGNFGYAFSDPSATPKLAEIVLVTPDGDARVVAQEMVFPNGIVITPDGRTLIVAESFAARLTAFDIEPDGSPSRAAASGLSLMIGAFMLSLILNGLPLTESALTWRVLSGLPRRLGPPRYCAFSRAARSPTESR